MSSLRCVALVSVLAACATPLQVDPSVGSRANDVARALELAVTADVPAPPLMPYICQTGWIDLEFGTIVAVHGDAFATRIDDPKGIPDDVLHYLVDVDDDGAALPKGDGVVTDRIDDILVCRFFPVRTGPVRPPCLGDHVWLDWPTTEAVRHRGWKEECERAFARASKAAAAKCR